jgi:acylphosphatase
MPPPRLPMPSTPKPPPQSRTDLTRHYRVSGKVQGVYYRHSTRAEARRLNLRGTVRNLSDGSVEVLVQGAPAAVEALRLWLHRGPAHARVDRVSELALGDPADLKIPEDFEVL